MTRRVEKTDRILSRIPDARRVLSVYKVTCRWRSRPIHFSRARPSLHYTEVTGEILSFWYGPSYYPSKLIYRWWQYKMNECPFGIVRAGRTVLSHWKWSNTWRLIKYNLTLGTSLMSPAFSIKHLKIIFAE